MKLYMSLLIAVLIALVTSLFGCGADDSPQFSKEEISEYAKQQSSDIMHSHYKGRTLFQDVAVSNLNHWFESDITLHVSCTVLHTFNTASLGAFRIQKQHTFTFQVNSNAISIERSIRFVSVNPSL